MRWSLFALFACGPLLAADAPAAKKGLDRLQGNWELVRVEAGGKDLPADKIKGGALAIQGDKYVFKLGGNSAEGTYRVDPSHKPAHIDATRTSGPDKGKVLRGIYSLEGGELKMCFNEPGKDERPKKFGTGPDGGHRLYVFKRAKP